MRFFILVTLVALQIFLLNCDVEFDTKVTKIDSLMQVRVFGYVNRNNFGPNKGCCGSKINDKCDVCQYRLEVKSTLKLGVDKTTKTTTLIAIFSSPAARLFENYQKSFLYSSKTYSSHQLAMLSISYLNEYTDIYQHIYSNYYSNFRYSLSYGEKNTIQLGAEVTLRPRGEIVYYYFAMLRIDAIRWIQNKDSEGNCCSGNSEEGCPDKCGYNIEWRIGDSYIDKSDFLLEYENNNYTRISYTLVSQSVKIRQKVLDYNIDIVSSNTGKVVDRIVLKNITDIPNVEYSKNRVFGIYGNIWGSVSWMHNCNSYGGYNCINFCSTDSGTEFCDLDEGKTYCLNGASDENTCENLPKICKEGLCRNGGICIYTHNGDVFCSCPSGYSGKLCQDWQCDSRCNENGNCIGPNECNCNFPYTGNDCEEYPCIGNNSKKCLNGGSCKVVSGTPICRCQAPFLQGDDCSTPICPQVCVFGKCQFVKNQNITNCVCSELYEGSSCNVLKITFREDSLQIPLIISLSFIIILYVVLFTIYFRSRADVILLPISKIDIIDSTISTELPSTIADQNEVEEDTDSTRDQEWSSNMIIG